MKTFEEKLFTILTDYGDFFLAGYPSQSETKSIHPTKEKIIALARAEALKCVSTARDKPWDNTDDAIDEIEVAIEKRFK